MPMVLADADDLAEGMGGLLPPADKDAMDREFTEWLTETFHRAGAQRTAGVVDDGQAAVRSWGFDVGSDHRPHAGLPGSRGRDGAFAHGEWLAAHVPGTEAHLTDDDGHLTW